MLSGKINYSQIYDSSLDYVDFLMINDAMKVHAENEYRFNTAAQQIK